MRWLLLQRRESMGSRRRQRFWSICWMFVALDRCTAHFTLHASHITCHMSHATPQAARALEAGKVFSGDTVVCCANDCNARANAAHHPSHRLELQAALSCTHVKYDLCSPYSPTSFAYICARALCSCTNLHHYTLSPPPFHPEWHHVSVLHCSARATPAQPG